MRRSVSLLAGILLVASSFAISGEAGAAPQPERLHATPGQPFVNSSGPVTLFGPNVQPIWDPKTTDTWSQGTYHEIRRKGFTAVRMVLFWDDFEPQQAQWNKTAFDTLKKAVGYAKDEGLYVVLDCIHLYGGNNDGKGRFPAWTMKGPNKDLPAFDQAVADGLGFLQYLAGEYANETAIAAYDPINEPYHDPADPNGLMRGYAKVVDAIRAKDKNASIMLEPSYGDAKVPSSAFTPFNNNPNNALNLIWSIHDYYPGGAGEGYGDDGSATTPNASQGNENNGPNDFTEYKPGHTADLEAHLNVQLDLTRTVGLPLWIGEFGIASAKKGHNDFIDDYVALFKNKGLGFAWWEYKDGGSFRMINPDDDSWLDWVDRLLPR
ncbi:glycoside hydrolase family 5 protein [Nocardia arthritidis]|uniref:glycoside hydrolase family 5 protein n=1 Tax=Nocardia arthritidis TaxID=228602 RepID=UPI00142D958B|nr:cellulase family glycosylhydrolase [Nocardia arthritidis]